MSLFLYLFFLTQLYRCDERGSLGSESESDTDQEIKKENTFQIKTDEDDTSAKEDDGEE